MVKRREKTKKEKLNLTLDIFNKRYNSQDWDGRLLDSVTTSLARQKLQPSGLNINNWISMWSPPRRGHQANKMKRRLGGRGSPRLLDSPSDKMISSEDEVGLLGGGSGSGGAGICSGGGATKIVVPIPVHVSRQFAMRNQV